MPKKPMKHRNYREERPENPEQPETKTELDEVMTPLSTALRDMSLMLWVFKKIGNRERVEFAFKSLMRQLDAIDKNKTLTPMEPTN